MEKIDYLKRGFKGVWIPKEIWLDFSLTWMEKLFVTEINSLDNEKGCFASNDYFSKFFNLSKGRCSQIIKSILNKGIISVEYEYEGKEIKKRVLKILKGSIKDIKGGYLENIKESNKSINNKYKEKKNLFKKKETLSIKKIDISIKEILEIIKEKGGFSTILPSGTKSPTATVLKSVRFIECLLSGFIEKEYIFDKEWLIKNKINLGKLSYYFTQDDLKLFFKKASTRFGKMRKEGNWPYDKSKMTKSIEDWLYNPRTKKSWFLYCLFNRPKSVNTSKVKGDNTSEEIKELFMSKKLVKKEWLNNNSYWKKAKEIYDWYEKIKEDYNKYHIYESGDWQGVCGNIKKFLGKYKEFIDTWETWNIGNFGLNNATWNKFIIYMKEKYSIILDVSERSLKKALEYHERETGK